MDQELTPHAPGRLAGS